MKSFFFFTFILCVQTFAQTLSYSKFDSGKHPQTQSSLTITSPFGSLPSCGYYLAIATVKNEGSSEQTWTLSTTSSSNSYRLDAASKTTAEFSLTCPAKQTKTYHLRVPVHNADGSNYYNYSAHLGSYGEENSLRFKIQHKNWERYHNLTGQHADDFPATLITNKAVKLNPEAIGEEFSERASLLKPELLTDDLLILKSYEVICLTSDEWNLLNASLQDTILKWMELGGHLIFFETKSKLDLTKFNKFTSQKAGSNPHGTPYGLGAYLVTSPMNTDTDTDEEKELLYFLSTYESDSPLHNNGMLRGWTLSSEFGKHGESALLIILILIAFAVAVGPLNFYVFAKQGRRHRLFYTTAAISAISSVVLISIIFIKDGIGGEGLRLVHKEIDSESNTAFVMQEQISKTGLLLGTAFNVDESCDIIQLNHNNEASLSIAQTDKGIACSGDFFQSKSRQGQLVVANQISQEKFELRKEGDKLYVTSTFSYAIGEFYYLDDKNTVWKAENLKTGGEIQLSKMETQEYYEKLETLTKSCSTYMVDTIKTLSDRPNSFIAYSDKAKGIETHPSISWETEALYTGILKP